MTRWLVRTGSGSLPNSTHQTNPPDSPDNPTAWHGSVQSTKKTFSIVSANSNLQSRLSATHLHCKNTSSQQIKKSRPHHRHPAHHLHLESSIATVKYWKPIHLKLWELHKASHPLPSTWPIQIHVVCVFVPVDFPFRNICLIALNVVFSLVFA